MNQRQRNEWIEAAKEQVLRNAKASDRCESDLMELYDECANGLENEIRAFYSKYAKENQLTESEASKLLSGKEYSAWKRSLEGYLKDIGDQGKDSKLMLELNTLAAKSQISRKEQLLANVYRNMSRLAGRSETELTGLLSGLVETNYERKMYDIQTIGKVSWDVSKVDEKLLKQILNYPWSGKHYSKALWDNTDQLAALTRRELTLGFMSGAGVDRIAGEINAVMGKGMYAAQRLVRTEASYFANQGQILAYQEAGVTRYRFLGGGCEICQKLNGKVFDVKDAKAGENLPPIHPNCKCTTVAAYDIPVFKERQGNPLKSNPKFEEWKRKHMEDADSTDGEEGKKKKGFFAGRRERKEAADVLQTYARKVNVTGEVNLKNYKKAAEELERQLSKVPFGQLDEIMIFDSQDYPGRMGATAAKGKRLRLGTELMNRPEQYYEGSVLNWQKRIETAMGRLRSKLMQAPSEAVRSEYSRQMELRKYSRGNVLYKDKEIACVIQHEMMHMILNDKGLRDDTELKKCYNHAMKNGDIYGISYRASENEREFICEAAVMYENGEPLPGYVRSLIKRLKSYET